MPDLTGTTKTTEHLDKIYCQVSCSSSVTASCSISRSAITCATGHRAMVPPPRILGHQADTEWKEDACCSEPNEIAKMTTTMRIHEATSWRIVRSAWSRSRSAGARLHKRAAAGKREAATGGCSRGPVRQLQGREGHSRQLFVRRAPSLSRIGLRLITVCLCQVAEGHDRLGPVKFLKGKPFRAFISKIASSCAFHPS